MGKYIRKGLRAAKGNAELERGVAPLLCVPEMLQAHPEIQRYINGARRALLKDISPEGPEHLSAARKILMDRCLKKLSVALLIEATLTAEKIDAARPVVGLWVALQRQIRDDLRILGLDRRAIDKGILTIDQLLLEAAADAKDADESGSPDDDVSTEGGSE